MLNFSLGFRITKKNPQTFRNIPTTGVDSKVFEFRPIKSIILLSIHFKFPNELKIIYIEQFSQIWFQFVFCLCEKYLNVKKT
jgi:hypothetical protein